MSKPKLKITNLYKIFGNKGASFVSSVRDGMTKQELLEKHNHVLYQIFGIVSLTPSNFEENLAF